jgi:hypothetical protein
MQEMMFWAAGVSALAGFAGGCFLSSILIDNVERQWRAYATQLRNRVIRAEAAIDLAHDKRVQAGKSRHTAQRQRVLETAEKLDHQPLRPLNEIEAEADRSLRAIRRQRSKSGRSVA